MATLSEQALLPYAPEIVEAMAAARAISFAQEIGLRPYILEGDAEVVINTLKSNEESPSSFGHIISLLNPPWIPTVISFSHVCRVGNK